jgi:hypothetical protein
MEPPELVAKTMVPSRQLAPYGCARQLSEGNSRSSGDGDLFERPGAAVRAIGGNEIGQPLTIGRENRLHGVLIRAGHGLSFE